ncbi:MAG: arginine deiminase [Clostridiaceae bacterium]|nr:arginine deiminase [Clostridiaceae bacterium]
MSCASGVHVYSEIGPLRRVLLHRPGRELENVTPLNMESLLFDDIPDAVLAAQEHDKFAQVFRDCGTEVIYLKDLLAELLEDPERREDFLRKFLLEAEVYNKRCPYLLDYLMSLERDKLADTVFSGLRREEFSMNTFHLADNDYADLFWFDPIPNAFFMRDPMTVIANGVAVNCMWSKTRKREAMILEYLHSYHPVFASAPRYFKRNENAHIEGGDVLVLSDNVILIGVSERTEATGAELLARNVISDPGNTISHALVLMIPRKRAFMHLDTVFTMVDRDVFTIHPEILSTLEIYDITLDLSGNTQIKSYGSDAKKALTELLGLPEVELIYCGGASMIDARREQWGDGANSLAVAPGEVIVYERNRITNRLLREAGIKVHEISSSELSRGRGGPRCMSMPLWRDDY